MSRGYVRYVGARLAPQSTTKRSDFRVQSAGGVFDSVREGRREARAWRELAREGYARGKIGMYTSDSIQTLSLPFLYTNS